MPTYAQYSGGSGQPLVLIHGFTATWRAWEKVIPALEEHHRVLAVTLAGHFEGRPFEDAASTAAMADALERDLDDCGIERAHLVGNSLGGWMALELAKRGRALSVVALSPAGGWEPGSKEEKRVRGLFNRNYKGLQLIGPRAEKLVTRPRLRALLMRDVVGRPENVSAAEAYQSIRGAAGCSCYLDFIDRTMSDGPPKDFDGIDVPARIAWGTKDRILPVERYSERMRRLVPHADFVELPGLGHVPMTDDPALIARTILEITTRSPVGATA